MTLTVGSLFSGIGGLDLGLERASMEVIWQSEIDPYGCRVLEKHWPEVVNHGNIKDINWRDVVRPDVICGGYPCQPFSTAGKRQGTDDPRHLWPWVRDAISELRPRYAILENVRGHVSLGLSTVLGEMASIGYDAEWQIVSAASVGAPHRRDRVLIVAYPVRELADTDDRGRLHGQSQVFTTDRWLNALRLVGSGSTDVADANRQRRDIGWVNNETRFIGSGREEKHNVANTDNNGSSATTFGGGSRTATDRTSPGKDNSTNTQGRSGISGEMADSSSERLETTRSELETSRPIRGSKDTGKSMGNSNGEGRERSSELSEPISKRSGPNQSSESRGWSGIWQSEPDVGRVANGIPSRVDRLRGLGNAVVPQVAELVGRMVMSHYEETE